MNFFLNSFCNIKAKNDKSKCHFMGVIPFQISICVYITPSNRLDMEYAATGSCVNVLRVFKWYICISLLD